MRIFSRIVTTGLLAGALALAALPASAFAEGGPPTKNVGPSPWPALADTPQPIPALRGNEGEPPGTFAPAKLPGRPKAGEVTLADTPVPIPPFAADDSPGPVPPFAPGGGPGPIPPFAPQPFPA
ncbi:hypothetical protein [Amycolatopsis sp. NPDC058986]|uniref:hypothetical protein n=1 Tax=unclassified Amycolatopsis TaxID=2618356 RepID=UPI003671854F